MKNYDVAGTTQVFDKKQDRNKTIAKIVKCERTWFPIETDRPVVDIDGVDELSVIGDVAANVVRVNTTAAFKVTHHQDSVTWARK